MSAAITESAAEGFLHEYIADLNRLLEAALAAERQAQFEVGEFSELEPLTPWVTSAVRSAVDRLNSAREWREAIAVQLAALAEGGRDEDMAAQRQPCTRSR